MVSTTKRSLYRGVTAILFVATSRPGGSMKFSKAHFIGIAGKGMSATALLLREMGVKITGSDEGFYPPVSDYLKSEKIPFAEGYRK